MRPSFPLRIVAILMAVGDIGHTSGVLRTIPRSLEQGGLLAPLQQFHIVMMGTSRTHWDFYVGFGLAVTCQFLLVAGLAWLAANLADEDPARARPFVYLLLAAQTAGLVIGYVYFFAAPLVMTLLTLICLVWTLFLTSSRIARTIPDDGGSHGRQRTATGLDAA
jgi:hypothetical protein